MPRRAIIRYASLVVVLLVYGQLSILPAALPPLSALSPQDYGQSSEGEAALAQQLQSTMGDYSFPEAAGIGKPVLISDRFKFTEGPVWDKQRGVLLFSDIEANRIYQLVLPNTLTVLREPSNKANGLAFDMESNLIAAEHGSRSITRMLPDGKVEVLADDYLGRRFNSPNDLIIRKDGTIYFTDPTFGLENRQRDLDFMGLFRIEPSGELVLEARFSESPNGVALSPDESVLYLALTKADVILAFDVNEDGSLGNKRKYANIKQPDGIAVDAIGNIYAAGLEGIYVFSAEGVELGIIETIQQPTNCDFGGQNGDLLFITARGCLYYMKVSLPSSLEGNRT